MIKQLAPAGIDIARLEALAACVLLRVLLPCNEAVVGPTSKHFHSHRSDGARDATTALLLCPPVSPRLFVIKPDSDSVQSPPEFGLV